MSENPTEFCEKDKYISALDTKITWLSNADNELEHSINSTINSENFDDIKEQFNNHETFIRKLMNEQGHVFELLKTGKSLLEKSTISPEDQKIILDRMQQLNLLWESIRVKTLDYQTELQSLLNQHQKDQITTFESWLHDMEMDYLNNQENVSLTEDESQRLKTRFMRGTELIKPLSNMLIIVDSEDDQEYKNLENKLSDLQSRYLALYEWLGKAYPNTLQSELATVTNIVQRNLAQQLQQPTAPLPSTSPNPREPEVLMIEQNAPKPSGSTTLNQMEESPTTKYLKHGTSPLKTPISISPRHSFKIETESAENKRNKYQSKQIPSIEISQADDDNDSNTIHDNGKESSNVSSKKIKMDHMGKGGEISREQPLVRLEGLTQEIDKEAKAIEKSLDKTDLPPAAKELIEKEAIIEGIPDRIEKHRESLTVPTEFPQLDPQDAEKHWESIMEMAENAPLTALEKLQIEIYDINEALRELEYWFRQAKEETPKLDSVGHTKEFSEVLENFSSKMDQIKSWWPKIENTRNCARLIANKLASHPENEDTSRQILKDTTNLIHRWESLFEETNHRFETLVNILESYHYQSFREPLSSLNTWLDSVKDNLITDQNKYEDVQLLEEKLTKLKEIQGTISAQAPNLVSIQHMWEEHSSDTDNYKFALKDQFQSDINSVVAKYEAVNALANDSIHTIENQISVLKDYLNEIKVLKNWMGDLKNIMDKEATEGDTQSQNREKEAKAIQEHLNLLKPTIENINRISPDILDNSQIDFAKQLKEELAQLNDQWKLILDKVNSEKLLPRENLIALPRTTVTDSLGLGEPNLTKIIPMSTTQLLSTHDEKTTEKELKSTDKPSNKENLPIINKLESDILALQEWIVHEDMLIMSHADDEHTAQDIERQEYAQMIHDFETKDGLLRQISKDISQLQTDPEKGGVDPEKAKEMAGQLKLLKTRFDDLRNNFETFELPTELSSKFNTTRLTLDDIKNNIQDLIVDDAIEPDAIKQRLNLCMKECYRLNELKSNTDDLKNEITDKLVNDRSDIKTNVKKRLDGFCKEFNTLADLANGKKQHLEHRLDFANAFYQAMNPVKSDLNAVNQEFTKRQQSVNPKTLAKDLEWIQTTQRVAIPSINKLISHVEDILSDPAYKDINAKTTYESELNKQKMQMKELEQKLEACKTNLQNIEKDYHTFSEQIFRTNAWIDKANPIITAMRTESNQSPEEITKAEKQLSQLKEESNTIKESMNEINNLALDLVRKSDNFRVIALSEVSSCKKQLDDIIPKIDEKLKFFNQITSGSPSPITKPPGVLKRRVSKDFGDPDSNFAQDVSYGVARVNDLKLFLLQKPASPSNISPHIAKAINEHNIGELKNVVDVQAEELQREMDKTDTYLNKIREKLRMPSETSATTFVPNSSLGDPVVQSQAKEMLNKWELEVKPLAQSKKHELDTILKPKWRTFINNYDLIVKDINTPANYKDSTQTPLTDKNTDLANKAKAIEKSIVGPTANAMVDHLNKIIVQEPIRKESQISTASLMMPKTPPPSPQHDRQMLVEEAVLEELPKIIDAKIPTFSGSEQLEEQKVEPKPAELGTLTKTSQKGQEDPVEAINLVNELQAIALWLREQEKQLTQNRIPIFNDSALRSMMTEYKNMEKDYTKNAEKLKQARQTLDQLSKDGILSPQKTDRISHLIEQANEKFDGIQSEYKTKRKEIVNNYHRIFHFNQQLQDTEGWLHATRQNTEKLLPTLKPDDIKNLHQSMDERTTDYNQLNYTFVQLMNDGLRYNELYDVDEYAVPESMKDSMKKINDNWEWLKGIDAANIPKTIVLQKMEDAQPGSPAAWSKVQKDLYDINDKLTTIDNYLSTRMVNVINEKEIDAEINEIKKFSNEIEHIKHKVETIKDLGKSDMFKKAGFITDQVKEAEDKCQDLLNATSHRIGVLKAMHKDQIIYHTILNDMTNWLEVNEPIVQQLINVRDPTRITPEEYNKNHLFLAKKVPTYGKLNHELETIITKMINHYPDDETTNLKTQRDNLPKLWHKAHMQNLHRSLKEMPPVIQKIGVHPETEQKLLPSDQMPSDIGKDVTTKAPATFVSHLLSPSDLKEFKSQLESFKLALVTEESALDVMSQEVNTALKDRDEEQLNVWLDQIKEFQRDLEGHRVGHKILNENGKKVLADPTLVSSKEEVMQIRYKIDDVNAKWDNLKQKSNQLRTTLEQHYNPRNAIAQSLDDSIGWVQDRTNHLAMMKPLGGDVNALRHQAEEIRNFNMKLDEQKGHPLVQDVLKNSQAYLTDTGYYKALERQEMGTSPAIEAKIQEGRDLENKIVALDQKWSDLIDNSVAWENNVQDMLKKMEGFNDRLIAVDIDLKQKREALLQMDADVKKDPSLASDKYMPYYKKMKRELVEDASPLIHSLNSEASDFLTQGLYLSKENDGRLQNANEEYEDLLHQLDNRINMVQSGGIIPALLISDHRKAPGPVSNEKFEPQQKVYDSSQPSTSLLEQQSQRSYPEFGKIVEVHKPRDNHPPQMYDKSSFYREPGPSSLSRQSFGTTRFVEDLTLPPLWAKALTDTGVPYYVDIKSERTYWTHPLMMEVLRSLSETNFIKYSAYRTAMKLRIIQKRLFLYLLNLNSAIDLFDQAGLRDKNEEEIHVPDLVTVSKQIYTQLHAEHPHTVTNVPYSTDILTDWVLDVFDPERTGKISVLAFKVAIVLLCRAHLNDKYRYLFQLVADPSGKANPVKLAELMNQMLKIPIYLGEIDAFGGPDPSISAKACFDYTIAQRQKGTNHPSNSPNISNSMSSSDNAINAHEFITWADTDPQSIVWLPVLYRLASAETAKHQSKCNICKCYPIIGLRYRCLKCFNFDICQNCFFQGKKYKSHKPFHPMHEYSTPTTTGEDVKDMTKTLKNKLLFRSKKYFSSHPKFGYTPIKNETIDSGQTGRADTAHGNVRDSDLGRPPPGAGPSTSTHLGINNPQSMLESDPNSNSIMTPPTGSSLNATEERAPLISYGNTHIRYHHHHDVSPQNNTYDKASNNRHSLQKEPLLQYHHYPPIYQQPNLLQKQQTVNHEKSSSYKSLAAAAPQSLHVSTHSKLTDTSGFEGYSSDNEEHELISKMCKNLSNNPSPSVSKGWHANTPNITLPIY